jgi:hypothetical protein
LPQKHSGLTAEGIASNIERINEVFPSLSKGFYKVLCERIKDKKFTDWEFTNSVNHVIDTCKYPNPQIAEFISYIIDQRPRPEEMPEKEYEIIIDPVKEQECADFMAKLLAEPNDDSHYKKDFPVY